MGKYLDEFMPDLKEFEDRTMKFHNEEISVKDYKGFSGGYGSYAQRGAKKHMLRLRMAGGRLTKDRMKCIFDICDKYTIPRMKLTTGESVQLHDVEASDLTAIMEMAWKGTMISRGGGGDFPRNVMMSPLSGVEAGEYFDVAPYVEAASEYLMNFIKGPKFPRKLKVCFSNSKKNYTHATFRDMGFVAREDGKFDLYIAGGLGANPKMGVLVAEAIEPTKILYYIKAMVDTFVENGNYDNRAKARTRYMQETLGVDGLKKAFLAKLDEALEKEELELDFVSYDFEVEIPDADGKALCVKNYENKNDKILSDKRVIPQKQDGLYSVFYQPIGGIITVDKLKEIYKAIEYMDEVELRITPEEGIYIINCDVEEVKKVLVATTDGARDLFETSVACIGATTCQGGIGDSQGLLNKCVEAVRKENFKDGVLPKIHISGCPSSCAAHQCGEIGFRGGMKPSEDGPKMAFAISIGGNYEQGKEVLAPTGKAIYADEIPDFLVELGRMISKEDKTYEEWIEGNMNKLEELVARYTA